MNFTDRIRDRGWFNIDNGEFGEQGRCLVHRVQNNAGEKHVVKLIKPFHMSQVRVNFEAVDRIINSPRPDIEVLYRERWDDPEGLVILMDEHQFPLRRWITENQIWYRFDWFPIMAGIAIRLAHAHAMGIVHMDLKPSNILIDRLQDGRFFENGVYISDFGMPFYTRLPVHGQPAFIPGTRAYISPEIIEHGEATISTCSDVWALGCIGYELCLGRKLAGNREFLKRHIREGRKNPQPLEELIESIPVRFGDEVRMAIRACLAWEPQIRCSAAELRDFLLTNK